MKLTVRIFHNVQYGTYIDELYWLKNNYIFLLGKEELVNCYECEWKL